MNQFMKKAIEQAKMTKGHHLPNPMVGSVIVKDNKVIGKGFHNEYGSHHAEVNAIKDAKDNGHSIEGADIYVTLQPCSRVGKTPSCTEAIIKNKFKRVIVGSIDKSDDESIRLLKEKGVEVELLDLKEIDSLIKDFAWNAETNKPYVYAKIAISKDGYSTTANDEQKWITNASSREDGRKLRSKVQAILVGRKTIEIDNPFLNTRKDGYRDPVIVVLDPELKISKKSNIFLNNNVKKYIFINEDTKVKEYSNTELIKFKGKRISSDEILKELFNRNIKTVLVEGGADTLNTFIDEDNVNMLYAYISDKDLNEIGENQLFKNDKINKLSSLLKQKTINTKTIENDRLEIHEVK